MEQGKIVFEGKSDKGTPLMLRYPKQGDAKVMCDYINALSEERTFVRFQGEHMELEEEQKFLDGQLEKIKEHKCIQILVFAGDELIGIAGIDMGHKTDRHIGNFGISISKKFRGEGIGKLLMETVLDKATKELSSLEIIKLAVFANNKLALKMYKDFGFVEYGSLPNGVKLEHGYDDHIYMFKVAKNSRQGD